MRKTRRCLNRLQKNTKTGFGREKLSHMSNYDKLLCFPGTFSSFVGSSIRLPL